MSNHGRGRTAALHAWHNQQNAPEKLRTILTDGEMGMAGLRDFSDVRGGQIIAQVGCCGHGGYMPTDI